MRAVLESKVFAWTIFAFPREMQEYINAILNVRKLLPIAIVNTTSVTINGDILGQILFLCKLNFSKRRRNYVRLVSFINWYEILFTYHARKLRSSSVFSWISFHKTRLARITWLSASIASRLDQSFLRRRLHHVVHLYSRIAELLSARTVSATCSTLLPGHHEERRERYKCDDKEATYYRSQNHRDIEGLTAQEIPRLKIE